MVSQPPAQQIFHNSKRQPILRQSTLALWQTEEGQHLSGCQRARPFTTERRPLTQVRQQPLSIIGLHPQIRLLALTQRRTRPQHPAEAPQDLTPWREDSGYAPLQTQVHEPKNPQICAP